MSTAQPPSTASRYPDRSTRLMLLGIFQILLGCLCGLMAVVTVAASLLVPTAQGPEGRSLNREMMTSAVALYLPAAVAFIWLGVGLARARRWALSLTIVLSWMWLILGLTGFVMLMFLMRPMAQMLSAQQPDLPPEAILVVQIALGGFAACAYLILPGVILVFCHGRSVRATCEQRDPRIPWTDRCPMPVLALSISLAFAFASMPLFVAYGSVIPLFGVFVSGAAGTAVIVLIELVLAYLTWGTYRLQMAAWWGTLLFGLAGALDMVITFMVTDMMEMYEKMKMSAADLETMRKMGVAESMSRWAPWLGFVGGVAWVGYMLYVRRDFVQGREDPENPAERAKEMR